MQRSHITLFNSQKILSPFNVYTKIININDHEMVLGIKTIHNKNNDYRTCMAALALICQLNN